MNNNFFYKPKSTLTVGLSAFFNALIICIISLMLLVICFYFSHSYYYVVGSSMEPNLWQSSSSRIGNGCYIESNASFSYGDIVVAISPTNKQIVKRVIAMPGDEIGYYQNPITHYYQIIVKKSGQLASAIDESYLTANISAHEYDYMLLKNETSYKIFYENLKDQLIEKPYNDTKIHFLELTDNQVFLLGDNRDNSIDCSKYGAIEKNKVFGKVVLTVENNNFHLFNILKYLLIG